MREQRVEDAVINVRFPQKKVDKKVKFSLYLASQFDSCGLINISGKTYPPAPLRKDLRDEYWSRKHYRIMIDEKWLKPKAQYTFYTLDEVLDIIEGYLQ